jgi:hypothetical protein
MKLQSTRSFKQALPALAPMPPAHAQALVDKPL